MTNQKHFDAPVSILTGGRDRHYALGLASALLGSGRKIEFVGSDDLESLELAQSENANVLNLRGDQSLSAGLPKRILRVLAYYVRLIRYAATTRARVFHVLWNNKFEWFDRTFLTTYYKLLGKKIVFTAHNVNAGTRDGSDSWLNRATLRFQYRMCDHIFVHTQKMKDELVSHFDVSQHRTSVIPYGFNNKVTDTALTRAEARDKLGLRKAEKVVLFFGMIAPYKGLEYLVEATAQVTRNDPTVRLVIAGQPKKCDAYWEGIQERIARLNLQKFIIQRIEFLPDADIEVFFKAADVLVLPYTYIFQSGVLLMGYAFGLPIIATDVGSLKEGIVSGETGFVCRPGDAADLARTLETYFESNLYCNLETRREHIRAFAVDRFSWRRVAETTRSVYKRLLPDEEFNVSDQSMNTMHSKSRMSATVAYLADFVKQCLYRTLLCFQRNPNYSLKLSIIKHKHESDLSPISRQFGIPLKVLLNQRDSGLDNPAYRFHRDEAFFSHFVSQAKILNGCSWLDVGAGTGALSVYLSNILRSQNFELCDVCPPRHCNFPVRRIDGTHLDYESASFDLVLFNYVLHHAGDNTIPLLRDAHRIARRYVVITEDPKENAQDCLWAYKHDDHGTFRGLREWKELFALVGFSMVFEAPLDGHVHRRHFFLLSPNKDIVPAEACNGAAYRNEHEYC